MKVEFIDNRRIFLLTVVMILNFISAVKGTPIPGDDCYGIDLTPVPPICVSGSTQEFANNHDCGLGHDGPDVVYHFTIPEGLECQILSILAFADFDADFSLATSCDMTASEIGCWDVLGESWYVPEPFACAPVFTPQASPNPWGYFRMDGLHLEPDKLGNDIYFWIDGNSGSSGNYQVHIDLATPVPTKTPANTPTPTPPIPTPSPFSTGLVSPTATATPQ